MCMGKKSGGELGAGMMIGGADPFVGTLVGGKGLLDNNKAEKQKTKDAERKYRDSLIDKKQTATQTDATSRWLAANRSQPFSGGSLLGGAGGNSRLGGA